jgi:hypothetical protein
MTFSWHEPGVSSATSAVWRVFAENTYHVLLDQQPAICRSVQSYAILAGIAVNEKNIDAT